MPREIHGARYLERASAAVIKAIEWLPYSDFQRAEAFYRELLAIHIGGVKPEDKVAQEQSRATLALLGCNDRYFLLTALCHRVDAQHPWVYDRCREVEAEPYGFLDLWARGHFKSTCKTFAGTIQEVVTDPEITIGIFGNTKEISRPFLSQIKEELENNDLLKFVYDDVLWSHPRTQAPSWSLERGLTVKRAGRPKECTIEAHGLIDAMPTGKHFRVLRFDDVITEKNVTNPEQIAKATERVELADNLGHTTLKTLKDYTGTRYSYADSYGQMIAEGVVKPRIYPATEDGTLDGAPVLFTPEVWADKKRAQRSTIAAQMLQNPLAGKENTFRIAWLKSYWVIPTLLNVYILGDPSRGKNKTSDRTALAVIGIDVTGNKYLLDGYCHRMPLSERWEKLEALHRKWSNVPGVQLVKVGYERYGAQSDDEYFEEKMRKTPNARFSIEELNWTGERGGESKTHRVERLEPDFRVGNFFVPAKVWHPGVAQREDNASRSTTAIWRIKDGSDEIEYEPVRGPHRLENAAKSNGEHWRIMDPLRRLDQDGNIYDLTRVFFEEFSFFPFSPRKDLIDATSRIYDMEPTAPVKMESVKVADYPDS